MTASNIARAHNYKVWNISHITSGRDPGQTLWFIQTTNPCTLQWRHNGGDGLSNHQPHDCLLKCLFRRCSMKTSKLRVTGLCAGNHWWPVNSQHKWPVTRKMFPFHDLIMLCNYPKTVHFHMCWFHFYKKKMICLTIFKVWNRSGIWHFQHLGCITFKYVVWPTFCIVNDFNLPCCRMTSSLNVVYWKQFYCQQQNWN